MEPSEHDLRKHDDWARSAVDTVIDMPAASQHNLLMHIFRVAAYCEDNPAEAAAVSLCADLRGTIELHRNESYRKAVHGHDQPASGNVVTLEDAIAALSR